MAYFVMKVVAETTNLILYSATNVVNIGWRGLVTVLTTLHDARRW
jgi:hypothetical protein